MGKSRPNRRTTGYAKAHFAECVREAEAGRSIVLTRHGRDVARLEPVGGVSRPGAGERGTPADVAEPATPYAVTPSPAFQSPGARRAALHSHLVEQIWPRIPEELLGRGVSKREREEILGYAGSAGESSDQDRRPTGRTRPRRGRGA
jgi:antitoxin (DNA-binding transcriptional repressor) of toxin-antitoxin stability system